CPATRLGREHDAGHQRRLLGHSMILITARAALDRGLGRRALPAGFEIGEPLLELALDLLVTRDRLARLFELAHEQGAQLLHRLGSESRIPPALEQPPHLLEREAHRMEQVDPSYPLRRPPLVEAETTSRARGRLQESQFFIEMDRPDGLPSEPGEIADADQMAGCHRRSGHRNHTLTYTLDSVRNLMIRIELVKVAWRPTGPSEPPGTPFPRGALSSPQRDRDLRVRAAFRALWLRSAWV